MRKKRTIAMFAEIALEMQADDSTAAYCRRTRPFASSHGSNSVRSRRRTAARVKSCRAVDGHGTAAQRMPAATAADRPVGRVLDDQERIPVHFEPASRLQENVRRRLPALDIVSGHGELEEARQSEAVQRGGDNRRRRRGGQRQADSRSAERVQHVRHAAHRSQGPAQQSHGARHPRHSEFALPRREAVARAQRAEHVIVGASEEVLVQVRNVIDTEVRQQRVRGLEVNRLRVDQDAVHVEDHRLDFPPRARRPFAVHSPPVAFDRAYSGFWILASEFYRLPSGFRLLIGSYPSPSVVPTMSSSAWP